MKSSFVSIRKCHFSWANVMSVFLSMSMYVLAHGSLMLFISWLSCVKMLK